MNRKQHKTLTLFLIFILFLFSNLNANHLKIQDAKLTDAQTLVFVVSWENFWNLPANQPPANHDAVWFFAKYKTPNGGWKPLVFSSLDEHTTNAPDRLSVAPVADGLGVFLKPETLGAGKMETTSVALKLKAPLPAGDYELLALGIEMAYVPQGAFWVGDSASVDAMGADSVGKPFFIDSEAAISVGQNAGQLYGFYENRPNAHVPAPFPKGFAGFYAMKYEISQEQYVVFLNTLTFAQQKNRTTVSPEASAGKLALAGNNANRSGVAIKYSGSAAENRPATYGLDGNGNGVFDEPDDAQTRACNWLSWGDLAAYLDWSGLRPMTEFEFEKACRGGAFPQKKEFPWGTQLAVNANTPLFDGTENEEVTEKPSPNAGLANHGAQFSAAFLQGPLRSGFAAYAESDRVSGGFAYYGVADMGGNVWEPCIRVDSAGVRFTGANGDGELTESGFANAPNWPDATATGVIVRGGGWNSWVKNDLNYPFRDLSISDRFYADLKPFFRRNTQGGRGVRSN